MRVDIAKLDSLMGILGEIHISKSAFGRIAGELRAMQGFTGVAVDLHKIYRRLERKLNELQEGILDVRMVPMSQIFTRLAQAVKKVRQGRRQGGQSPLGGRRDGTGQIDDRGPGRSPCT